jgi:flagellar biosynthesis protein FliP
MLTLGCGILLSASRAEGASFTLNLGESGQEPVGAAIKMALVLTAVALAPALLLAATSFVRIAVVFSFVKTALGVQAPPGQVLTGLALFLTAAIMAPVGTRLYHDGLEPYLDGKLPAAEAYEQGAAPLREFMLRQTREADLALFYEINHAGRPSSPAAVGMHLLVPAFIISELRTGFEMGFLLFIPFLLVDFLVAAVLMALGMVMVPPAMVSLPMKLLLFVLADGWNLLVASLVRSFG